ncbi:MAG: ABC transporter ATP-binding protein [Xanthobacteraceae bacterium]
MLAPQASGQPAVAIREVTLHYFTPERETLALANISLTVECGEFIAVVGSSGCGKSTLLSIVSGLLAPSGGEVFIEGRKVTAPSPRVGYMFQKDTLLEWRTVLDNVLIGAELLGLDIGTARNRARELLRRYGLGDFMGSMPHQLSGGMRQRAALARTLCPEPELLLLDEPFSALDYQTRLALSDEIAGILAAERKTVILVTHDIGEAISMADRVVVMSRRPGRIKSEHRIHYPSYGATRPPPLSARKCPEFAGYFQAIWDELDLHQAQ